MRYFLLTIIFFIGFSFVLPGVAIGQNAGAGSPQFTILNPPSSITAGSPATDAAGNPVDFIQTIFNVYKYAQLVAVALAAIMITMGGINIAVSGAIDRQAEGKDMIKSAIFGLVLLFGANLILRTINPALTNLTLSSPDELPSSLWPHCEAGQDPARAQENKCLPECTEDQIKSGEHQKTSPTCYVPIPLCDANLMASCQGIFVFGEEVVIGDVSDLSSRIALLDEQRSKAFDDCRTAYLREDCLEEKGYYGFANESAALRAQMRGVPVFPQCKISRDCENGIGSHTMSLSDRQIKVGARYGIYPFYPKNKGVEEAQCLTIFFETNPDRDSEEGAKWAMSQRRGLKRCPIDPFNLTSVSEGGNLVELPELTSPASGGSGGGPRVPVFEIGGPTIIHRQAYNLLRRDGINVWSSATDTNNCLTVPPCSTSLEGMPRIVIANLQLMKRECDCTVTVTGGTETIGHGDTTEHGQGRPVVDIAVTTSEEGRKIGKYLLDNWNRLRIIKVLMHPSLQSTFSELCDKTKGAGFSSCNDEGENHFHVVFGASS